MFSKRFAVLVLVFALFLSACNAADTTVTPSANIESWVEAPNEGSILPMEPVMLVVYASASEQVSFIAIMVNGQSLPAIPVSPLTTDGSSRLVRVDYAWTPPGQGEYLVEAAGVNLAGATGGSGSTRFCIVTCQPSGPTVTPAPVETGTPTPATTVDEPTVTPITSSNITVQFFAEPGSITAGSCSYLRWNVITEQTVSVYFGGDLVGALGNFQTCPCASETHTLRVVKVDGSAEDYYATVNVTGSCNVEPPTTVPPTVAPPPADTTGPTFSYVEMRWPQDGGCTLYGWAGINDPSGVSQAVLWVNFNDSGWIYSYDMAQSVNNWYSLAGLNTGGMSGTVQFQVRAVDNFGNEAWSGTFTKSFTYCGE
jgi:hypothetical protein